MVDIDENEVKRREILQNPGHHPGALPEFLKERQVDCIMSGGMGRKAQDLFNRYDMATIVGVRGDIDRVIDRILEGTLEDTENLCSPKHTRDRDGACRGH